MRDGKPCFLSEVFYRDYPHESYPEIEAKRTRPHIAYLVALDDGTWFAIPLRLHIGHPFGFKIQGDSGLDYSKASPSSTCAMSTTRLSPISETTSIRSSEGTHAR